MPEKMRQSILIFLMIAVTACSVKEARWDCKCRLTVDLSQSHYDPRKDMTILICENGVIFEEKINAGQTGSKLRKQIQKGDVTVSAIMSPENYSIMTDRLILSEGDDADSLWMYSKKVKATGETACDTVILRKEYCAMTLVPIWDNPEIYPYDIEIEGNVIGISITDLTPVKGQFRYRPVRNGDNTFTANIPRQTDGSLAVNFYDRLSGKCIRKMPIGLYMEKAGYDWNKENLDDIYLDMDSSYMTINVTIQNWETGQLIEKKI